MRVRGWLAAVAWAACGTSVAVAGGADLHRHPAPHGHDHSAVESRAEAGLPPPPAGLQASLADVVRPTDGGRIAWQTFWKLCWAPVGGAAGYELRRMTSEGSPRRPQRIDDTCWQVEVAAGENPPEAGLYRRELMLGMQAAQSGLRVRAVFPDGKVSAWSAEFAVGAAASGARQTP